MDLAETEVVKPIHSRPIGPAGHCTYCGEPIGATHKPECVCVQKTYVVRLTIDVVTAEPRSHDKHLIESVLSGELSYCASNTLRRLGEWDERNEDACACGAVVSAEVLREATEEDHAELPLLFDPAIVGE